MTKDPLRSHDMYFNRELSWLEFNDRVLRQGLAEDLPLLERVKFLAIVSSNLDEFFLVRVAGLMSARAKGVRRRDPCLRCFALEFMDQTGDGGWRLRGFCGLRPRQAAQREQGRGDESGNWNEFRSWHGVLLFKITTQLI